MDIGTISLILMVTLIVLLAIGMPLGLASAALAVLVLVLKFEPTLLLNPLSFGDGILTSRPGTGPQTPPASILPSSTWKCPCGHLTRRADHHFGLLYTSWCAAACLGFALCHAYAVDAAKGHCMIYGHGLQRERKPPAGCVESSLPPPY